MKTILYHVGFSIEGDSGKSRATAQKISALRNLGHDVRVLSVDSGHFVNRLIWFCKNEISSIFMLDRVDLVISRGFCSILLCLFCKRAGVTILREVHADLADEIKYTIKTPFEKKILRLISFVDRFLNKKAHIRVFNNPLLKDSFEQINKVFSNNHVLYNGFSPSDISNETVESKQEIFRRYGLSYHSKYVLFTGSCSLWHDLDLLYEFSLLSERYHPNIKFIVAGGKSNASFLGSNFINITPLGPSGCAELVSVADACIVPIKNVRVSPGNALKMYDYFGAQKLTFTPSNMPGYSDEADNYNGSVVLDFDNVQSSFEAIVLAVNGLDKSAIDYPRDMEWRSRMEALLGLVSWR